MAFGAESTAAEVVADHDLSDCDAIVTGGTSGLGAATAAALGRAGAAVVITGRDRAKGRAAVARLRASAGTRKIWFEPLDLGNLSSVDAFVRRRLAPGRPLHLLVANAGVLTPRLTYTVDGFEAQFGINHLGHFALTTGLLPALAAAGTSRVVVLSSRAHRRSDVDFADPNYRRRRYEFWSAYGQSKTANALFSVALTRRHAASGITANAVMPGTVVTDLARQLGPAELAKLGWIDSAGERTVPPGWKSAEQGAATVVWAAVASELDGIGGHYLENCAIGRPWDRSDDLPPGHYRSYALDPERAERLWVLSETLIRRSS